MAIGCSRCRLTSTGVRVHELDNLRDAVDDADLAKVAQLLGNFWRHTDNVVLTNGHDLDAERVLVVKYVAALVMRQQLLRVRTSTNI